MTIVVYWRTGNILQVVADTRISGPGHVYTDAGPKVLLLNIQSRAAGKDERDIRYRTYGFAYAGSSLAALSAYAVVSNCLANLVRHGDSVFPSVFTVARWIEEAANRYIAESKPPAPPLLFEGVVFGACGVEKSRVAVAIEPRLVDGVWRAQSERAPIAHPDVIGMLGQSARFVERLNQWHAAGKDFDPHGVIDEMIADPNEPTVGGTRQLAISAGWDVEVVPVAVPAGEGRRLKTLLAGIDVSTFPFSDGFSFGYQVQMPKKMT